MGYFSKVGLAMRHETWGALKEALGPSLEVFNALWDDVYQKSGWILFFTDCVKWNEERAEVVEKTVAFLSDRVEKDEDHDFTFVRLGDLPEDTEILGGSHDPFQLGYERKLYRELEGAEKL